MDYRMKFLFALIGVLVSLNQIKSSPTQRQTTNSESSESDLTSSPTGIDLEATTGLQTSRETDEQTTSEDHGAPDPTPTLSKVLVPQAASGTNQDWLEKFLATFRESGTGGRAIFLGVIERDAAGSSPVVSKSPSDSDSGIHTDQHIDNDGLTFRASSGDTQATLVISNDRSRARVDGNEQKASQTTRIQPHSTTARQRRMTGQPANLGEYFQRYTPNSDDTLPTIPSETSPTWGIDTFGCSPRLNAGQVVCECDSCTDKGYTYLPINYPVQVLNEVRDGVFQLATSLTTVGCTCVNHQTSTVDEYANDWPGSDTNDQDGQSTRIPASTSIDEYGDNWPTGK